MVSDVNNLEGLMQENKILKKRCYDLSGGAWCNLCELVCCYKTEDVDDKKRQRHHHISGKHRASHTGDT